ncbi:uncharacterized protein EV422DRAFT_577524 [Fimicolochytrium jonesii]|uniref:uncharacterized protein n=1 Tax=Fimicolochytrium jonesii TaxID=1396493 RepID=UPI0022FE91E9|nr:uncharacterized protein EV422DRAFT_577524 [Fimicolochytrium jonesii]KAI8822431.1 hypothetical protein EV422DRAFT_577524 [Fimicolochytrium jonesii]
MPAVAHAGTSSSIITLASSAICCWKAEAVIWARYKAKWRLVVYNSTGHCQTSSYNDVEHLRQLRRGLRATTGVSAAPDIPARNISTIARYTGPPILSQSSQQGGAVQQSTPARLRSRMSTSPGPSFASNNGKSTAPSSPKKPCTPSEGSGSEVLDALPEMVNPRSTIKPSPSTTSLPLTASGILRATPSPPHDASLSPPNATPSPQENASMQSQRHSPSEIAADGHRGGLKTKAELWLIRRDRSSSQISRRKGKHHNVVQPTGLGAWKVQETTTLPLPALSFPSKRSKNRKKAPSPSETAAIGLRGASEQEGSFDEATAAPLPSDAATAADATAIAETLVAPEVSVSPAALPKPSVTGPMTAQSTPIPVTTRGVALGGGFRLQHRQVQDLLLRARALSLELGECDAHDPGSSIEGKKAVNWPSALRNHHPLPTSRPPSTSTMGSMPAMTAADWSAGRQAHALARPPTPSETPIPKSIMPWDSCPAAEGVSPFTVAGGPNAVTQIDLPTFLDDSSNLPAVKHDEWGWSPSVRNGSAAHTFRHTHCRNNHAGHCCPTTAATGLIAVVPGGPGIGHAIPTTDVTQAPLPPLLPSHSCNYPRRWTTSPNWSQ